MTQKESQSEETDTTATTSPTELTQNIESTEPTQTIEEPESIESGSVISAKERKAAREAEKKKAEYFIILKRTLIAISAGTIAGIVCFYFEKEFIGTQGSSDFALLSILIMISCILVQKHIFMALHIDYAALQTKDWFFQGFMTFGFWFITWTILLSGTFDEVAIETAINATAQIATVS
jgi:hypothetical protein